MEEELEFEEDELFSSVAAVVVVVVVGSCDSEPNCGMKLKLL